MTSRKNINIFDFNGVNVAKHWHVAGEVFAISDCLVNNCHAHYQSQYKELTYQPLLFTKFMNDLISERFLMQFHYLFLSKNVMVTHLSYGTCGYTHILLILYYYF